MYFKFFSLSDNLEKRITKEGFLVNAYKDYSVFNGTQLEFTSKRPYNYSANGYIWEEIDSSIINERLYLLARTPYLSFDELWDLLLNSKLDDDRTGALVLMRNKHYERLRQKQLELLEEHKTPSKQEKRALQLISRVM